MAGQNKLENITLRGFGGGWNAIETDLQMESTYLTKLRNFRRTAGGTQRIRFGSKFHSFWGGEVPEGDTILDMEYFSGHLIFVFTNGDIWAAAPFEDGSGLEKTVIWNQDIAAALPVGEGEPPATGWSSGLTTVDFVPYKNELIIHNGIDKPITISRELETTYLADLQQHRFRATSMFRLANTAALCLTITVLEVSLNSQHLYTYRQLEPRECSQAIPLRTTQSPLTLGHLPRKEQLRSEELLALERIFWCSSKIRQ